MLKFERTIVLEKRKTISFSIHKSQGGTLIILALIMSQTLGWMTTVREVKNCNELGLKNTFTYLAEGMRFCVLTASPESLSEAGEEDTPKEKERVT